MLRTYPGRLALLLALMAPIPAAVAAAEAAPSDPVRDLSSERAAAAATAASVAAVEPAAAMPVSPTAADLQVALARCSFSPGEIDGRGGTNTRKALRAFQRSRSLPATGDSSDETWKTLWAASAGPTLVSYEITAADAAGPYLATIPEAMEEKAKLAHLGYTSILEMLGERFHAAPDFLRRVNPGARFTASEKVMVPNMRLSPAPVAAGDVRVVVSRQAGTLTVDRDGKVLFFAPVTSGSEHDPLPIGDWKVKGVARDPTYSYNPDRFWDADATDAKATIPPGPNGPVGVVWIDLDKPRYGLHGTPEPRRIGRGASHGCVRLTNWDAMTVASLVKPGTPVLFRP
jgi:lipoprotein-anchoring transpeptidase ErfK/SrfK